MGVTKIIYIAPRGGLEPTPLAFPASVQTMTPSRLPNAIALFTPICLCSSLLQSAVQIITLCTDSWSRHQSHNGVTKKWNGVEPTLLPFQGVSILPITLARLPDAITLTTSTCLCGVLTCDIRAGKKKKRYKTTQYHFTVTPSDPLPFWVTEVPAAWCGRVQLNDSVRQSLKFKCLIDWLVSWDEKCVQHKHISRTECKLNPYFCYSKAKILFISISRFCVLLPP